jgi:hypothetical protein
MEECHVHLLRLLLTSREVLEGELPAGGTCEDYMVIRYEGLTAYLVVGRGRIGWLLEIVRGLMVGGEREDLGGL